MLNYKCPHAIEFVRAKAVRFAYSDWVEPKLGNIISVLDMNVGRFRSFEDCRRRSESLASAE
jgi:hypothetical protein